MYNKITIFYNFNDYHSVITPEALAQLTTNRVQSQASLNSAEVRRKKTAGQLIRVDESRFIQAEESAQISIIEYLSENYEIEAEFAKGKFIADYDRRITYPVGVFVYHEGRICEVIRSMSGCKAPSLVEYWEEHVDINLDMATVSNYTQFNTYYAGNIVLYNDVLYRCVTDNGYKFEDIRIPMVKVWEQMLATEWQPTSYNLWEVVNYNGEYYTLMSLTDFDNNITPYDSDNWGMIADYDPEHNSYNLEGHDYVIYDGSVFKPRLNPNSDTPIIGHNITQGDPRNYNLKRHMLRLAIYELTKTIAPNNVSQIRMRDYEDSMKWLYDASKLKLNPQIPRKLSTKDNQPITDWQLATFQTDYNPHVNPWLV